MKRPKPIADLSSNLKNEAEVFELAKKHMSEVHGKEYTDDELRAEHLQTV